MFDYLIVGSGLFGSVFARQMSDSGKKCLVIESRNHIGGNVYTERIDEIDVHVYGPHIFHTENEEIWNYVNKFTSFNGFVNRPKVSIGDKIFSFPINLLTLHQLWGVKNPTEARKKLDEVKVKIENPKNLEEHVLSQVGEEIYHLFIKGYTTKQWQVDPKDLPADIIKRLPIRLTFDDNYYFDKFQGVPTQGYAKMIENMLSGIEVKTGIDYFVDKNYWDSIASKVVFTGKIDQFYDYRFGDLQYRSLRFETEKMNGDFQGNAVVNYTDSSVPFTRIIEHKHFDADCLRRAGDRTIITREYPKSYSRGDIPYYPINNERNNSTFSKYDDLAKSEKKFLFGGRLAEYRYYDMHQIVGSALVKAKKEISSQE